jgi:hypothetical protein
MSNVEVNANTNTNANANKKQETRNKKQEIQNIQNIQNRIRRECQMQIWIQIQQGTRLCKTSAGEEPKIIVALKGQH